MAFFTGKGDSGTTKLFDSQSGARVTKAALIFECLGQLDELNAVVGWCKAGCSADFMVDSTTGKELLEEVQDCLFTIQAEVAGAQKVVPTESVNAMSAMITAIEKSLPKVTSFLVPGGTEFSARLDMARVVCRRAERRLVALHEGGECAVSEGSRAYVNRLSSFFYALTRLENHRSHAVERAPRYSPSP